MGTRNRADGRTTAADTPDCPRWDSPSKVFLLAVLVWGLVVPLTYVIGRLQERSLATRAILVTSQPIPMGTKIRDAQKFFGRRDVLKGTEPKGALTSFSQVEGRAINKTLAADKPIVQGDLMEQDFNPLHMLGPPERRLVTIRTRTDLGAAESIKGGSLVDVTHHCMTEKGPLSRAILLDAYVCWAEPVQDGHPGTGTGEMVDVTVEVRADDAERLLLAMSFGTVSLSPPEACD